MRTWKKARVLDEQTLGFAEFAGNKQYITLGNIQDIAELEAELKKLRE